MTQRRTRSVERATTPIQPGVGSYPDLEFLEDDADIVSQDIINKLNTGSRLLYALYMHPQAKELFSSPYMTRGLLNAYMAASKAWGL